MLRYVSCHYSLILLLNNIEGIMNIFQKAKEEEGRGRRWWFSEAQHSQVVKCARLEAASPQLDSTRLTSPHLSPHLPEINFGVFLSSSCSFFFQLVCVSALHNYYIPEGFFFTGAAFKKEKRTTTRTSSSSSSSTYGLRQRRPPRLLRWVIPVIERERERKEREGINASTK